jgi:ribonuclease Z
LTYELAIREVDDGTELGPTGLGRRSPRVTVGRLDHSLPSYGYRVAGPPRAGSLQVDRLRALGLGPGKWYGQLKAGESVTMPDGRVVCGLDYVSDVRPGRVVVVTGDTRPTPRTVELARDADVLVHESTYSPAEADLAPRYAHSTCLEAAEIARQAGVGRLLLTHFSARYSDADLAGLETAARAVFPATQVMRDLEEVRI